MNDTKEKKTCLMCGGTFMANSNTCPECNGKLVNSSELPTTNHSYPLEMWEIIISIIIPIIGIIMGLIKLNKDDRENGKKLIIISVIAFVISFTLYSLIG